jgi:hypothetical protein
VPDAINLDNALAHHTGAGQVADEFDLFGKSINSSRSDETREAIKKQKWTCMAKGKLYNGRVRQTAADLIHHQKIGGGFDMRLFSRCRSSGFDSRKRIRSHQRSAVFVLFESAALWQIGGAAERRIPDVQTCFGIR